MEEREALKREIELLQNLINTHKSVHGDAPFARDEHRRPEAPTSARGRGHSTSVHHHDSSRGRQLAPHSRGSWRKTYSLSNKNPQSSVVHTSASTSSVGQSQSVSHSTSLPSHSREEKSDTITTAASSFGKVATEKKHSDTLRKTGAAVYQHEDEKGTSVQHEKLQGRTPAIQDRTETRRVLLPKEKNNASAEVAPSVESNTLTSLQSNPQAQIKPSLTSKTSTGTKLTATTIKLATLTTANAIPPLSGLSEVSKQPSVNPTNQSSKGQAGASFTENSKFTWIKSQTEKEVEPKQASSIPSPKGKSVTVAPPSISKAGVAGASPPILEISKKTPTKKLPRKISSANITPKTSKYKWVSSSAGAQARIPRKSLSPKSMFVAQRAVEKGETTKKPRAASTPSPKIKKGIAGSSPNSSLSSRYRWKAGGWSSSAAATGVAAVARRRSAFHWTSEKNNKGVKGGLVVSPSVTQRTSLMPSSSPAGFKLRSRMKIIRRSATGGAGSEKGGSPSAVKYSPRGRTHSYARSPTGGRRTPSRELVSFGRHKLRRLSPTSTKTGPASSSHRSPASTRVFRTRYKMVTRPGSASTAHTLHYNPALSWRAKRIQSARSFLQNRMRAPHDRQPSPNQHWRGSSMCWIRGSLYRVSANKLSRTVGSNMSINRTGRSFSPAQVPLTSPAFNRPYSSRNLASRAVQRSIAIIRNARQKKQPKQYCMYYNRFGKCNRGNSCPYIHDPDKVAVCTRFLRGTCKLADGSCPFSHKVAKEKMPVCSYFLKGICNNSDCPYSHVYVSRKAEVCEDFVKGYCPEGEKCKKKHTLVCPDFSKSGSCPRGARCKLQHRQRAKRSASNSSSTAAKRGRNKEPAKRPRLSVVIPQDSQGDPGTPTKGPLALPSFISLSSSPEDADAPVTLLSETSQVKEKRLQIKPRL
ncbi:zinc finger CCCH domain-containing protein 3 [Pseudochaenichthys georgianus]|uniref:zinc finger CCCH domain-containing protein 3 n=1 Tax=Pseudochaenichthys georgianus TaxID=52239 RepID=UPI00146F491C|nr:zinc finger CCCH domain-containing protein 3 [Pseudochaenichthys georgianus]